MIKEKRKFKREELFEPPQPPETKTPEKPKGREDSYFFPKFRKTVRATSIEEATAKINKQNV